MRSIRVLVTEDSLTIRKRIREVLESDPGILVIGEAEDGKRAIELCDRLRPDLVTMDMMLPVMSGLAATEYIMAFCPTPILIVSSSTNRGELFRTYEALAAGAVEALEKPNGNEPDGDWERRLIRTVKLVSGIKVITHPKARIDARDGVRSRLPHPASAPQPLPDRPFKLVALGTSTGGPAAILGILKALPAPFPLPVLLAIHIGEPFGKSFVEWLDGETAHSVVYARDGEPLKGMAGRVVMAPPDRHMVVRSGRLFLTEDPARHSCRPSVDVLFESLARECGASTLACLLTGMGRDGAAGLLAIRNAGGFTIAQDEASSIVFGMPREAIALGAACRVLPLDAFPALLSELADAPVPRKGNP